MSVAGVPALRFRDFEGVWEERRLANIGRFKSGVGFPDIEQGGTTGVPFLKVSDMNLAGNEHVMSRANHYVSDEQIGRLGYKVIQDRSIIFAKVGAAIFLERKRQAEGFLIDNNMMAFIPSKEIAFDFCVQKFSIIRLSKFAQVGALPSYNSSDIGIIKVAIPALPEQQKIADFLGAADARVGLLRRRRDALRAYKKGMVQRLFSQSLRFTKADGSPFPDWQEKRLGEVLTEHGERSSGAERVHSVSVHKGVIDQIEHLGRSFSASNTDHYGLVKPGDVIYTKSPTGDFPFGIIKQSRLSINVIVSPLYAVFTPKTKALGCILNEHFLSVTNTHNYLHQLVQKGAKNTINVTNQGFLQGKLVLPIDPEEQQKIACTLTALDAKIDAVTAQMDAMQRFKKGLLQQMFV